MAAQPPDQNGQTADTQKLTSVEITSIITTAIMFVLLLVVAVLSYKNQWLLSLAFSGGGLGGLVHEIAQSRGRLLFFKRESDGLYLGAIAGVMLGGVAGVLVVRGYLTGETATTSVTFPQMSYEIFLAGLAMKGVAEAAGTATAPTKK